MVRVQSAIESGDWLRAELSYNSTLLTYDIRCKYFYKVNLYEINKKGEFPSGISLDANIWVIGLDVINKSDERLYGFRFVKLRLVLMDEEGFEFSNFFDHLVTEKSKFAKQCGSSGFLNGFLEPYILHTGALLYEMPESFENIFLAVSEGNLRHLNT